MKSVQSSVWVCLLLHPECCILDQEVTSPLKLVAEVPLSSGGHLGFLQGIHPRGQSFKAGAHKREGEGCEHHVQDTTLGSTGATRGNQLEC